MRIKLTLLLSFVFFSIHAQPPHTYVIPGTATFKVPAGVTSLNVECCGAGGGITGSITGGGGWWSL